MSCVWSGLSRRVEVQRSVKDAETGRTQTYRRGQRCLGPAVCSPGELSCNNVRGDKMSRSLLLLLIFFCYCDNCTNTNVMFFF